MSKKAKHPKYSKSPVAGKTARVDSKAVENSQEQCPVWKFSILDIDGFGWKKLTFVKADEILKKLKCFEGMRWSQICMQTHGSRNRSNSHNIKKEKLCKEAQKRLQEINQDDVDELFSLRCGGTERLFGIRQGAEFRILWYDADHEICPV